MTEDPYWTKTRPLHRLLSKMPNVNPASLPDDARQFLADYKPQDGSWDEEAEILRNLFVNMSAPQFQSVLETYRQIYPA